MLLHLLLLSCLFSSSPLVSGVGNFTRDDFPSGFIFGSGTSAYQVEGAALEDGRTPSIWDTYAYEGMYGGGNGDVACDQYHKYKEDVRLMSETNLEAYRFSISWSRLIPNGRGPVNEKGLQYYNNLIDELISHDVCFKAFGDRVLHWTTLNEPNVFIIGGYDEGFLPPRHCSIPFFCRPGNSSTEPYIAGHNMLLAHASAVSLYRTKYKFPVMPEGLYKILEHFKQFYGNPPIYIHENGQQMPRNGTLNDTPRVEYFEAFIGTVLDSIRNGSNIIGYFAWSLLDGLELLSGYKGGFGLYYVDLDDKERSRYPKYSQQWYAKFLQKSGFKDRAVI
nr:Beta-glucosidase 11 [Ipomoea batatas]GMD15629.1 Beta-glucosidase 11 [Ipomoea batatas]GMD82781.1 Beta-glucosidase 11 [Ipomoea batatas]